MNRPFGFVVWASLGVLALSLVVPLSAQQKANMDPALAAQVGKILAGRRLAPPPPGSRARGSLYDIYQANVRNVPLVVSAEGTGSSAVIFVDSKRRAYVITNHHVVAEPFRIKGQPRVLLVFYNPTLKNQYFNAKSFVRCMTTTSDHSDWCEAVVNSTRLAAVVADDPTRDLALLLVGNVPHGVSGFAAGNVATLQPGDTVAVIGNPEDLLWSLTTGIVSAVRTHFPLGSGSGTMIQTQAPVNPGNSGGPLIGPDGKLAGVVFAGRVGDALMVGHRRVTVPAPGLNYAIGVNEVIAFVKAHN